MRTLLTSLLLLVLALPALALETPSIGTGKTLFESARLGTSGKSCATCHPGGQGLENSVYLDEVELVKTINLCISKPLAGTPLDPASTEMDSLVLYIRSLYPAAQ